MLPYRTADDDRVRMKMAIIATTMSRRAGAETREEVVRAYCRFAAAWTPVDAQLTRAFLFFITGSGARHT